MKISLITPTFNSSETIIDCLNSLNIQTYNNIEHIVIDNLSSDNTLELVRKNARFETKIFSEKDFSVYEALNKGIEYSTGDVIGILHSDDTLASSETIKNIMKVFSLSDNLKKIDVVYGDLVFIERNPPHQLVRRWISCPFKKDLLKKGWMPPHPTVFMIRDVYKKYGLFDTRLKCSADYDYILRVFGNESLKSYYLPEVITCMKMGGISTKGIKNLIKKKIEDYYVLKKNNMPFPLLILIRKNFSKINQLFPKYKI